MINERFSQLAIEIKRVNHSESKELKNFLKLNQLAAGLEESAEHISHYVSVDDFSELPEVLRKIEEEAGEILRISRTENVLSQKGEKNYRFIRHSAEELLRKLNEHQ